MCVHDILYLCFTIVISTGLQVCPYFVLLRGTVAIQRAKQVGVKEIGGVLYTSEVCIKYVHGDPGRNEGATNMYTQEM